MRSELCRTRLAELRQAVRIKLKLAIRAPVPFWPWCLFFHQ